MPAAESRVVLLHGVGLDHTMWAPLIAELERPAVALDLPGHGSQPALREPQSLAELSRSVMSRLPGEPVHLVGFSLGALIAQHIARFAPEQVHSLISVSSVCGRTPEEAEAVEARLETAGREFAAGVDEAIERWYPAGSTTVPTELIDETREVLLRNDFESYVRAYTVFARGDREIAPELSHISHMSLAITGEYDPGSTPEMAERLAEAIPNCRAEVIPGVRHMLPVESPAALAQILSRFVNEVEGNT